MLTENQEMKLVYQVQQWLGHEGIVFFQGIKETHGTLDAIWCEPQEADFIPQFIPRSINAQEGKLLRDFMKTCEECSGWEDKDFDSQWVPVLEKCIQQEEEEND